MKKKTMNKMVEKAIRLQMNGFIQEALSIFKKAYDKNPNDSVVCEFYGAALAGVGQYNLAKKLLKKVLQKKIEKPQVLNNLATCNRFLKLYDEALINVQSALKFRPNYQDAWVNCGNIYCDLKQYSKAIDCYKKAIKLNPDDKEVYLTLANTYLLNHEFEQALAIHQQQKTRFKDVRFLVGELICYRAMEDFAQALNFAKELRDNYNNELMWFEWVQTLWLAKEHEQAEQQAQVAIEKFGHYPAIDNMLKLINNAKVS